MADLNFPKDRTELVPPGTGSLQTGDTYTANGQTWVYDATVGAWGSGGGESSGDLFLSKINDDTAAGAITFEKLTTHEDGVKVTGGTSDPADGVSQISARSLDGSLTFLSASNDGQFLCFSSAGLYSEGVNNRAGAARGGLYTDVHYTENNSSAISFFDGADYGDVKGNVPKRSFTAEPRNLSFTAEDTQNYIAFHASVIADSTSGKDRAWGFYANTAPNFFQGNTYIGGNTTRNTRELWESTLTEEQKEQLEVGTFAIPANVSTPGDGTFARQWWYDQQSAEDQALIDSGELEYPEHLQAANFVDTFDLGDNTNVILSASGISSFKGGAKVSGNFFVSTVSNAEFRGSLTDSNNAALKVSPYNAANTTDVCGIQVGQGSSQGYSRSGVYAGIRLLDFKTNTAGNTYIGIESNLTTSSTGTNYNFYAAGTAPNYFAGNVGIGTDSPQAKFVITNDTGSTSNGMEFDPDNSQGGNRLLSYDRTSAQRTVFNLDASEFNYKQVGNVTKVKIDSTGNVGIGTTDPQATLDVSGDITCSGLINGAFSLRMESDDPAAFQTTYATDEEGNQVENQTYVGTTEDLLSIIKDLRARVAALESA